MPNPRDPSGASEEGLGRSENIGGAYMHCAGAEELRKRGAAKAQCSAEGIAPERGREVLEDLGRPRKTVGLNRDVRPGFTSERR